MELARNLRGRALVVDVDDIKNQVNTFLHTIVYNFIDRLLEEVKKALWHMFLIPTILTENLIYTEWNNFFIMGMKYLMR